MITSCTEKNENGEMKCGSVQLNLSAIVGISEKKIVHPNYRVTEGNRNRRANDTHIKKHQSKLGRQSRIYRWCQYSVRNKAFRKSHRKTPPWSHNGC